MKIIVSGAKGSGKSTLGKIAAQKLGIPFIEIDEKIEEKYAQNKMQNLSCRQIVQTEGEEYFRLLEKEVVKELAKLNFVLLATGGGTFLKEENLQNLLPNSLLVYLKVETSLLWQRVLQNGIPPFLNAQDPQKDYQERLTYLERKILPVADFTLEINAENEKEASNLLVENLVNWLGLRMFAPNTFGEILRVTTFGESHGQALGAVLDGVPVGVKISAADIQAELNRRRPGQSKMVTPRNEKDQVQILSGVYDGQTTGTPICFVVYNQDQDSSKYDNLKEIFRPGHADFTFWKKYGRRDHRGGGRSSGRETIGRVASGALALKILKEKGIEIVALAEEIAGIQAQEEDFSFIEKNPCRCADPQVAEKMIAAIEQAKKEHDSVGGVVKLYLKNLKAGIGDPVFYKLDARLAQAMFSLGAVKGVEIGDGFAVAKMRGSQNNDALNEKGFKSNHAGGILGGISTGEDVVLRIAVKPTPSIFQPQTTVNLTGVKQKIEIAGRHDPCIVPRIIPVVESMAALVVLDALLIQEKIEESKNKKI